MQLAIIDRVMIRIATHELAADYYEGFGTKEFGIDDTIRCIADHLRELVLFYGHRAVCGEIDRILDLHPEMLTASAAERAARRVARADEARRFIRAAHTACTAGQFDRSRRLLTDAVTIDPTVTVQVRHHRATVRTVEAMAQLIAS